MVSGQQLKRLFTVSWCVVVLFPWYLLVHALFSPSGGSGLSLQLWIIFGTLLSDTTIASTHQHDHDESPNGHGRIPQYHVVGTSFGSVTVLWR